MVESFAQSLRLETCQVFSHARIKIPSQLLGRLERQSEGAVLHLLSRECGRTDQGGRPDFISCVVRKFCSLIVFYFTTKRSNYVTIQLNSQLRDSAGLPPASPLTGLLDCFDLLQRSFLFYAAGAVTSMMGLLARNTCRQRSTAISSVTMINEILPARPRSARAKVGTR